MNALIERFMDKVSPEPMSGCWLWTGSLRGEGYGSFYHSGVGHAAHRTSYELFVGQIPVGLQLDHLCRVRSCVNPNHLEPVTNRVNSLRGIGVGAVNAKKTHCPQGHPLSGDNLYFRVSDSGRCCRICMVADKKKFVGKWKSHHRKPVGVKDMSRGVERIKVEVGQVWEDCDKRGAGRRVTVMGIEDGRFAICQSTAKTVRINVNRFYPHSNGYRLISPVATPRGGE